MVNDGAQNHVFNATNDTTSQMFWGDVIPNFTAFDPFVDDAAIKEHGVTPVGSVEELYETCANSISEEGDQIVIKHMYIERRMTPLNIAVAEADVESARRRLEDFNSAPTSHLRISEEQTPGSLTASATASPDTVVTASEPPQEASVSAAVASAGRIRPARTFLRSIVSSIPHGV